MASSSGSGSSATQYDVFLSFRGPDTRDTFTDCLYRTMVGQGIVAYRDSEDLHAGDRIEDLLRAVGNSKICIPIFSRNYASSPWCLRELARMMELKESTGKPEILPIFFDVSASDVKLKTKLYVEDLEKYSNSGRTVQSLRGTRCNIRPARSLKAERGKRFLNNPAKSPISRTNAARLRSKLFSSS